MTLRVRTFSFDKLNVQKWLFVKLKWNVLPDKHLVDRYFEGVQRLKVKNDGRGLDFYIRDEDVLDLESTFGLRFANNVVVFAIGAAHHTKRLPLTKCIELCRNINRNVVIIGGPGDTEVGMSIAEACDEKCFQRMWNALHPSKCLIDSAEYGSYKQ